MFSGCCLDVDVASDVFIVWGLRTIPLALRRSVLVQPLQEGACDSERFVPQVWKAVLQASSAITPLDSQPGGKPSDELGLSSFLYALVGDLTQVCAEEMLNAHQKMLSFCVVFLLCFMAIGHCFVLLFSFAYPREGLRAFVRQCPVMFCRLFPPYFLCSPRFPKISR